MWSSSKRHQQVIRIDLVNMVIADTTTSISTVRTYTFLHPLCTASAIRMCLLPHGSEGEAKSHLRQPESTTQIPHQLRRWFYLPQVWWLFFAGTTTWTSRFFWSTWRKSLQFLGVTVVRKTRLQTPLPLFSLVVLSLAWDVYIADNVDSIRCLQVKYNVWCKCRVCIVLKCLSSYRIEHLDHHNIIKNLAFTAEQAVDCLSDSRQRRRSAFIPNRSLPLSDNDGGAAWFSWAKVDSDLHLLFDKRV